MKGYSFRSLTDLVLKIFKTKVNAGTGLSGGGSLEADRTLTVEYGTTAGTATQGNDSRVVNAASNATVDAKEAALEAKKADKAITITAGTGLSGGGSLEADRTLSVKYGTTVGTAAQGNDSRITGAVQSSQVVQVTGDSSDLVMSQAAVTEEFDEITEELGQVQVQGSAMWSIDRAPYPINAQAYHNGKQWITLRANSAEPSESANWTEFRSFSLRRNIKVTVGAGGDFPTINAAVLHLSRFTPDLGVTAEVELMSGFVMMEQLLVEGLDLGWITITGVDTETVINEPSLTRNLIGDQKPAFGVQRGALPTIGQLFRFSSKGNEADGRSGVMAHSVGKANILGGCGVKNAGVYGIIAARGSIINADNAIATGAGGRGIYADDGSTINARDADASGAGQYGILAGSGSTVNALYATANDAGVFGIAAYGGSVVNANNAIATGAGQNGIGSSSGSTINASGVDATGAGTSGFYIQGGSTVNADSATGTLPQIKNTLTRNGIIFQ